MDINIRKAKIEDANDFVNCLISCWQSAYKEIVPKEYLQNMLIEKEQRLERTKKSLANPGDCEYFCVMNMDKIIGFIIINKKVNENDHDIGEIWAIYLIEEFRSLGIGKKMLNFAINELKRNKNNKIYLWVFEENIRARKFYEKNNFYFDGIKREMNYGKQLMQLRYVLN